MIDLRQTIDIKEALNMRVRVSVDDRVVIDKRANSLLGNFIRLFYGHAGANDANTGYFDGANQRDAPDARQNHLYQQERRTWGNNFGWAPAQIASLGPPARLELDPNNNNRDIDIRGSVNGLAAIWTRSSNLQGFYALSQNSSGSDRDGNPEKPYLWEVDSIDPATNEVTVGNAVDLSTTDLSAFDGDLVITTFGRRGVSSDQDTFENPEILLGREYADPAIAVEDQWMRNDVTPVFDNSGTSIGAPAVTTNESEIEFSETFSNNAGYDIQINSVGIKTDDHNFDPTLISRELTNFIIPSGSSVTVTYFFTISNSGGGGVMAQFNELLYRQLAQGFRELPDILNNNKNRDESPWNFRMVGPGGDSRYGEFVDSNIVGRNIGPVVGASTQAVSNTDFALQDVIPHGQDTDGKLFHYGSTVEDFQINPSTGKAYFDVSRLFENRGSVGIDVNETGVYAMSAGINFENPDASHLLARHVLGTTQTVAAGEILKLTYRFEVNV